MAWMKSTNTGKFYLTGEFTSRSNIPQSEASNISDTLGFQAARCSPTAIKEELARVAENVALLRGETVDAKAIAEAVEAQLADEFAAIPDAVQDEADGRTRDRLS